MHLAGADLIQTQALEAEYLLGQIAPSSSSVHEVFLPFTAKLSVTFPHETLHILNADSPISACKTRVFVPICWNFDKDGPL